MPRTCIICGQTANSGEHVFPAALGGRRVNRGIYCHTHNNGFSNLAGALAQQLEMINALLGVRPDHANAARVLNVTTSSGDEIIVSRGSVRRANTSPIDRDELMHLQVTLGGPEGLQAIGYVALTFFAHHFREEARQTGILPIKAFIQGQGDNDFVWWESSETTHGLPKNPFEFGHTIVLTTSASTGEATAVISLFASLTLGVNLGRVEGARDRSVVVFIDPHADHPPQDIQLTDNGSIEPRLRKPEPMHKHLEQLVNQGRGQELLQGLFTKIERWRFRVEMSPVLDRLNATATIAAQERLRAIRQILEEQGARIYRLMDFVVNEFREHSRDRAGFEMILAALDAQIAFDPDGDGLSPAAQVALARAIAALITDLNSRLSQGRMDMEELWLVLSGGPGAHIVATSMFEPIEAVMIDLASSNGG